METNLRVYSQRYFPADRQQLARAAKEMRANGQRNKVKSILEKFHHQQAVYLSEDVHSLDARSLAEKHNAVIVSGIRTYGNLGPFRPVNIEDFKGIRLFDILLRPDQVVCCSSVSPNDTYRNLYAKWGIIIGEGSILEAFPYDAVTSVQQGKVISRFQSRFKHVRPTEQIAQAVQGKKLHNELDVKMHGITGLFYCLDAPQTAYDEFPSQQVMETIQSLRIPIYALSHGSFYRYPHSKFDSPEELRTVIQKGHPLHARDIASTSIYPTEEDRNTMIQYLTANLTLAPRNAITSGVLRGEYAYRYNQDHAHQHNKFFLEQQELLQQDNLSLNTYASMALYAFSDCARKNGDISACEELSKLASSVFSYDMYQGYRQRISEGTGNLTITENDLRYYIEHEELPAYLLDH